MNNLTRRLYALACVSGLCVGLVGCGPDASPSTAAPAPAPAPAASQSQTPATRAEKHKQYLTQLIQVMKEQTATLNTIVDVESAKLAVPQIKAYVARIQAISDNVKALGEVPPNENALLTTPLGKEMADASRAFIEELKRVSTDPVIRQIITDATEEAAAK